MDISIYEREKQEILQALQAYERVSQRDCILFIIDELMHNRIIDAQMTLEREYGYDEAVLKQYSIESIVKHLNMKSPTYTYSLHDKRFWRQINDPDKVRAKLDEEFIIWKNRLVHDVLGKVSTKGLNAEQLNKKRNDLNEEIEEAQRQLDYIKENFDTLDVKISSYFHRPSYGVIARFRTIDGKGGSFIRLKNSIPNALFVIQRPDEPLPHNKLPAFFDGAINAYGDVYYKEL